MVIGEPNPRSRGLLCGFPCPTCSYFRIGNAYYYCASVEFFRLPPILAPLLGFPEEKGSGDDLQAANGHPPAPGGAPSGRRPHGPRRCDSLSSVEPNVESSISSLSGSSGGEEESDDSSTELAAAPAPAAVVAAAPVPAAPVPAAPEVQRTKSATPHRRPPAMYKPPAPRASTARPKPQTSVGPTARSGGGVAGGAVSQLATSSAPAAPSTAPSGPAPPAAPPGHAQGKTREQGEEQQRADGRD